MAKKIEKEFEIVSSIIERHWNRAIGLANAESLMTYWAIGAFVSAKLQSASWGSKTIEALCDYLNTRKPNLKGYGKRNIYNMIAFYEAYSSSEFSTISEKLRLNEFVQIPSAQIGKANLNSDPNAVANDIVSSDSIVQMPSAQLDDERAYLDSFPMFLTLTTFSNHLEILGRCHSIDERVFYILYAARERLTFNEMRRSIVAQTYEMVMSKEKKMSAKLKASYPGAEFMLKDKVFIDFLRLPGKHNEHKI